MTRIRLDIEAAARSTARNTITPDQMQKIIANLNERLKQMERSDTGKALDKDLRKLDAAEVMKNLLAAIRRGKADDAGREIGTLAENYRNGTMTKDQVKQLDLALETVSRNTSLPGVAEVAGDLRTVIGATDGKLFKEALQILTGKLGRHPRRHDERKKSAERWQGI